MAFQPVRYSQQDPQWKDEKLGFSHLSLGKAGCAVTCLAMLLSGYGHPETPASLNRKLRQVNGFYDAAVVWGAINTIQPTLRWKDIVLCRDSEAPLSAINEALASGDAVLAEVDSSPAAGLQTHWVVIYGRKGEDYLILDPWPYPSDTGEVTLLERYGQGRALKRAISAVVFYEHQTGITPQAGHFYVRVTPQAVAGLRLRSAPSLTSETLSIEAAGSLLEVVEPEAEAKPKIGQQGQWLNVRNAKNMQGYVAAWFVEWVGEGTAPVPGPQPEPAPFPSPEPPPPSAPTEIKMFVRVKNLAAAGLRLREKPSYAGTVLNIEKAGARLRVLEPPESARKKIGKAGEWLEVKGTNNRRGFVMALYVEEE
ncbi:MAG: C39 family peptidase [Anaerolineales bacterium]